MVRRTYTRMTILFSAFRALLNTRKNISGSEYIPNLATNRKKIMKNIWSMLRFVWKFNDITVNDGYLELYRAVRFKSDETDAVAAIGRSAGTSWTWLKKKAYPYRSQHRSSIYFIFVCRTTPSSVDWNETVLRSIGDWKTEREIVLKKGAKIHISTLYEMKGLSLIHI